MNLSRNYLDAQISRLEKVCEQIDSVLPQADSERRTPTPRMAPPPLAERNVGGEPRRADGAVVNHEPRSRKLTGAGLGPSAEMPTPPIPDFGRDTARSKTYTAEVHWDVVNRDWYGNCAKCDADLGAIDESDIGHYVTCDCCATDNWIERGEP